MSNSKDTLALHAHTRRQAPTDSEARLWRELQSNHLGVAFRRQVPVLSFTADFYAPSARLIVEVDGGYHARRVTADARRDRKLERAGYCVVRLQGELVMRDLSAVQRGQPALSGHRSSVLSASSRLGPRRLRTPAMPQHAGRAPRRAPTERALGLRSLVESVGDRLENVCLERQRDCSQDTPRAGNGSAPTASACHRSSCRRVP